MTIERTIIIVAISAVVVVAGLLATPLVFAERIMPGVSLGELTLSGITDEDLPGVIETFAKDLKRQSITISVHGQQKPFLLEQMGVSVNQPKTLISIKEASQRVLWPTATHVTPVLNIDESIARIALHQAFASQLNLPKNASLTLLPNDKFTLVPSTSGEQVDTITLAEDIRRQVNEQKNGSVDAIIIMAQAPVQDTEIGEAQRVAEEMLKEGFTLQLADQEFVIKPFTIKRVLEFTEQLENEHPQNAILGARLQAQGLKDYITTTLASDINRAPVNARFEIIDGKVAQFAVPTDGQTINSEVTVLNINAALAQGQRRAEIAVDITKPDITDTQDIEKLGVTTLLASGESDFRGSPKNRTQNINVGASRYHGVLLPPNTEFSFLQHLGPVDAEHGFKQELVIKQNVTIPEFGGGLCQVSSTIFRAAVNSGLKVTERRNHSYAVRYYGTPGFDATIYPPYTDLRFLNNTPAYILIQTKIEGTKLVFEFWGTNDNRTVAVDGPHPYNRQPNGAVKATLKQTVVSADGQPLFEDTFYSNYKSPDLFPKVVAANGETTPPQVAGATTPNGNKTPPSPTPAPSAGPSN